MIRSHQPSLLHCIWLVCGCLFLIAGCGDGRIKTNPVVGKVLVNGQPAEKAMVIFCPTNGAEEFMRERPFDETDENGVYRLTTFNSGDGAPVGDYQVMIRWPAPRQVMREADVNDIHGDRGVPRATDRLRGRYMKPGQSGLTATVVSGHNDLAPFELEAPPRRR